MIEQAVSRHSDQAACDVVVGVDGGAAAESAVRWAAEWAAEHRHGLHIVCALDSGHMSRMPQRLRTVVEPAVATAREHAGQVLATAERIARDVDAGLRVSTTLTVAQPARLLVELSRTACTVVLGQGGHVSGLPHLGSVVLAVAAHAEGAVVVVRESDAEEGLPRKGPVVVGVDGSSACGPAVAAAFAEASGHDASIVAVHVWSEMSMPRTADVWSHPDLGAERAVLTAMLLGWRDKYPDVSVEWDTSYFWSPAVRLVEWSRSARLVVVGSCQWPA
jgi:nucleotide-binding universal stress UspA family protein